MRTIKIGPAVIHTYRDGDYDIAHATIPTKDGDVTIQARVSHQLVRQYPVRIAGNVARCNGYRLPARDFRPEVVGGFFGDIAKGFKKIAKSKAFKVVMATIPAVASHPAFAGLAAMIPGAGPAIAAAGPFIGPAAQMVMSATQGNPKAQAQVGKIMGLAAGGDPGAVQAMQAMSAVKAIAKKAVKAGPTAQRAFNGALRHAMAVPRPATLAEPVEMAELGELELDYDDEIGAYRQRRPPVFGYQMPVHLRDRRARHGW